MAGRPVPIPVKVPVPHKPPKHPKAHKPRKLALGEAVACCTAEALAASLRLAGWPVGDGDVLALHAAAGGSVDVGVSILEALQAAARVGLAGVRPYGFSPLGAEVGEWPVLADELPLPLGQRQPVGLREVDHVLAGDFHGASVILGAELPGPHALAVDGPGVWSWGEWHPWECFPGVVIEEAWTVTWCPR